MSKMSEAEIKGELESSSRAIESITGERVTLFRPPYGDYDDTLIKTCEKGGFYPIQWDVDSLDWKDVTASDIAMRIISRVKSGSIILCHNNAENTLEALPHVFADLQGRGYEFVKISELIYKQNYTVDGNGRQLPCENT
jgi:peptidoglycan/xylan/chitin deacetylase (PgdA/CDA1 family)